MRYAQTLLLAAVLLAAGCASGTDEPADPPQPATLAKVKVDRAGTIYLDGAAVTLDELKQAFARLKQEEGAVWYYREEPQGEPPPQAMQVMEAVVEARLPIRLMEHDFE